MCSFRKYPYPSQGRLTENPRGRGLSKAQFFKESVMLNWNFWRGGEGFKVLKKTSHGEYEYFLEQHNVHINYFSTSKDTKQNYMYIIILSKKKEAVGYYVHKYNIEGNTNQRQLFWMKLNWKSRDFLTVDQKLSPPRPRQSLKELVNPLQQIKQTNFLISKLCYSAVRML